jgi:hypothetical protein
VSVNEDNTVAVCNSVRTTGSSVAAPKEVKEVWTPIQVRKPEASWAEAAARGATASPLPTLSTKTPFGELPKSVAKLSEEEQYAAGNECIVRYTDGRWHQGFITDSYFDDVVRICVVQLDDLGRSVRVGAANVVVTLDTGNGMRPKHQKGFKNKVNVFV